MKDNLREKQMSQSKPHIQHTQEQRLSPWKRIPTRLDSHSPETQQLIKDVFADWINQIKEDADYCDGILLITDADGVVLANHIDKSVKIGEKLWPYVVQGVSWLQMGPTAISASIETLLPMTFIPDSHEHHELAHCHTLAVPIMNEDNELLMIISWVGTTYDPKARMVMLNWAAQTIKITVMYEYEKKQHIMTMGIGERLEKEAKRRDTLFQVAKKFHSKIDVDSVLSEVIESIENTYPQIRIDIYLSQDNESLNSRVKPLVFNSSMDICTRAFMEGRLINEQHLSSLSASITLLAAPLSGKQGVYGVLRIESESTLFDELDLDFISMLAATAGTAFENARLYEQSNLLISELRLINEITQRLNQSLKLKDIFGFATKELIDIFEAEYCCILQLDKETDQLLVQASNLPAMANELFNTDYGFSGIVFATKEPVIISDYTIHSKIRSKLMETTQSRSLIGSPIIVNSQVVGTILVTHRLPNFFSYENYKLLQVLSGHIGLAMINASLHAEVRRRVITDNLTGLYARHYLDEQVNLQQRQDVCGSLILVDIDFFKRVNDTYGHQVGDEILIQVSSIIKSSIRDSDIAARWGGEELAIYLPQVTSEQTMRVAERIRMRVSTETKPPVTVSCGISGWHCEDDKISVETLFYKADMALYEAKHSGKNQLRFRK